MFSSSQFDGASPFFSGSQFTSTQDYSSPDSALSKSRSGPGVLPVTVKQIKDAHDAAVDKGSLVIDGVEAANVRLVGLVVSKKERATDCTLSLDDGTGRIDIKKWTADSGDNHEAALVQNGMYVVVNGKLKEYQGNKYVDAFKISPIVDYNQVSLHFTQCIHVHLQNTGCKVQVGGPGLVMSSPQMKTPMPNEVKGFQTPVSNKTNTNSTDEDIYKLVLDVFEEPASLASDHGIHVDEVVHKLGLPANKIKDAINYHVDVGHIYSTIDDYHFKSAS